MFISLFVDGGLKIKCLLMCTAGFTSNHEREVKSLFDWLAVHLVWQCRKTHIFLVVVLKNTHKNKGINCCYCVNVCVINLKNVFVPFAGCQPCWQTKSTTKQKQKATLHQCLFHQQKKKHTSHMFNHIKQILLLLLNMPHMTHPINCIYHSCSAHYSIQTTLPWRIKPHRSCALGVFTGSRFTSLLLYGSNRPQGLLGLEGLTRDGKSNSTLLLCGKVESEPESDCALPATGGHKKDGVWGRSSPSASLYSSRGSCLWWWWCLWSCWWCPPWCWGSCIMFSTSESSEWLDC